MSNLHREMSDQCPVLVIEDRANDVQDICDTMQRICEHLMAQTRVVLVDEPGRDTWISVIKILLKYKNIRVVAPRHEDGLKNELSRIVARRGLGRSFCREVDELLSRYSESEDVIESMFWRYEDLPAEILADQQMFVNAINDLLCRGGICLSDVELRTLEFEFGAEKIKKYDGIKAVWQACRNKDAQLVLISGQYFPIKALKIMKDDMHIDYAGAYQKQYDLDDGMYFVGGRVQKRFPWILKTRSDGRLIERRIGKEDRSRIDQEVDLIIGPFKKNNKFEVSGRAIDASIRTPIEIRQDSNRGLVLCRLVKDVLAGRKHFLNVNEIKARNPYEGISRVRELFGEERGDDVVMTLGEGTYRLADDLDVGLIEEVDY